MKQQSHGIGQGMQKQKRPGHMPPRSPPRRPMEESSWGRMGSVLDDDVSKVSDVIT